MDNIEYDLADVIIERPHDFKVGRKGFKLYPVTLAKMLLLKRHIDGLDLNTDILKANPYLEALRIAKGNKEICCRILAYHTSPNTYKDLYDTRAINSRKTFFMKNLSDEDMASLMIYVLSDDKYEKIIRHLGLDKEREKLDKVLEVKRKDKSNLSFNGLSIFGTFIGQLKEMGYSDNEILYERSYTYLRLMLADKVVSIFLTDEERQELGTELGGDLIDANDPENAEKVLDALKKRGVKTD